MVFATATALQTSDEGNVNQRTSIRVRTPPLAQWILLWYWVGVSGCILLFGPQFLYNYGIEGIRLSHFSLRSLRPVIAESVKTRLQKNVFFSKTLQVPKTNKNQNYATQKAEKLTWVCVCRTLPILDFWGTHLIYGIYILYSCKL